MSFLLIKLIRWYKLRYNYLVGSLVILMIFWKKSLITDRNSSTIISWIWYMIWNTFSIFLWSIFFKNFPYVVRKHVFMIFPLHIYQFITMNGIVIVFWSRNLDFYLILINQSNFHLWGWMNPFGPHVFIFRQQDTLLYC